MIDLTKSFEFFDPSKDSSRIHIVGCGSVGSTVAENLARCGVKKFTLWDFDKVEAHNIVNQMFRQQDIGRNKAEALRDLLLEINDECEITIKPAGWTGQLMSGYIFLAVDSIEVRQQIVERHWDSMMVKAVFDVRTRLTDAQHYGADWSVLASKENLRRSMAFTHEEAADETQVSACGVTLGVATTVRLISALAVNNYINFVKNGTLWKFVQIDGFAGFLDCFN